MYINISKITKDFHIWHIQGSHLNSQYEKFSITCQRIIFFLTKIPPKKIKSSTILNLENLKVSVIHLLVEQQQPFKKFGKKKKYKLILSLWPSIICLTVSHLPSGKGSFYKDILIKVFVKSHPCNKVCSENYIKQTKKVYQVNPPSIQSGPFRLSPVGCGGCSWHKLCIQP